MKRQYKIYHRTDGGAKLLRTFAIYDKERSMCDLRALFVLETLDEPDGEYQILDTTEKPRPVAKRLPNKGGYVQLEYLAELEDVNEQS